MLHVDTHARALATLADSCPHGVAITDASGVIQYANPALGALLDLCGEKVAGQPIHRVLLPTDRFEDLLGATPTERRLVRADGGDVAVTVMVTPVPDGGTPAQVVFQVLEERRPPESAELTTLHRRRPGQGDRPGGRRRRAGSRARSG